MNKKIFLENNDIVNDKLTEVLCFMLFSVPAMVILDGLGIFRIPFSQIVTISFAGIFFTVSPRILYKKGMNGELLKYYVITAVSILISLLAVYPPIGIYITLILGAVISLLYFDVRLSIFACFLNYILMFVAEGIRMYNMYPEERYRYWWIAYVAGYTIEFFVVTPFVIWIAKLSYNHIVREHELVDGLKQGQRRYELALGSSNDVLYEYDINKDTLVYYGALTIADREMGKGRLDETVVEDYLVRVRSGGIFHVDDVQAIETFLDGDQEEPIQVRSSGINDFEWFEIEGTVLYNENSAVNVVGKIRNITEQKTSEKEFLQNSERDPLTGFYDRRIGTRILRQQVTEAGRTDTQTFLYLNILNFNDVREKTGSVFAEAILMKVADILRQEISDMDLPIRFSKTEFILYLINRTPSMLEQTQERIERFIGEISYSNNKADRLEIQMESYSSQKQIELAVMQSEISANLEAIEGEGYRSDPVSLTLNLLERSFEFDRAMDVLLERIGLDFMLDYIRIASSSGDTVNGICLYEWIAENGDDSYNEFDSFTESIPSLKDKLINIEELRKMPDVYIHEYATMIGEQKGYLIFSGFDINGMRNAARLNKLRDVAVVMSRQMTKQMLSDAEQVNADFLSSVSHEIRTPMSSIAGFSEMILQESSDDTIKNYADKIRNATDLLLDTINDIIDISRMTSGKLELSKNGYYLHDIVAECKNILAQQLKDKDVEHSFNMAKNIPDGLIGDARRVKQIISTLLVNSAIYTEEGEVNVDIDWENISNTSGLLKVCIKDTGVGIKSENIEDVFSIHRSAELQNQEAQGAGLSLIVVKNLLDIMYGSIKAETNETGGTTMSLVIPQEIYSQNSYNYDKVEEVVLTASGVPFTASWARVLVVDDNRVNMEVAKGLLGRYKVSLVTASSGQEAIDILENDQDFDLIFMDHLMPDMDGIEATQIIKGKGNPVLSRIPVVALTANTAKGVEEQFYVAGMSGYLAKPIRLIELAKVMDLFIPIEKRDNN